MSHTHVAPFSHIIFGAKNRRRLIPPKIRDELHGYIGGILRSEKCRLIKAGGRPDHLHVLLELHPTLAVASCVQKIKSNTSRWLKEKSPTHRKFGWQEGYAAFSVKPVTDWQGQSLYRQSGRTPSQKDIFRRTPGIIAGSSS